MRQLLERLETTTKTGVTLRVLSGGKDPKGQTVATPPATPASPAQGMAAVIQGATQQALPKATAPERFYVDQNAGVPMAQTVERNGMRLHRFMTNLHVLDLANAGKRGKTVSSFTLSGFDPRNDGFASAKAVAILEAGLKAIAKAKGYAQAVQIARDGGAGAGGREWEGRVCGPRQVHRGVVARGRCGARAGGRGGADQGRDADLHAGGLADGLLRGGEAAAGPRGGRHADHHAADLWGEEDGDQGVLRVGAGEPQRHQAHDVPRAVQGAVRCEAGVPHFQLDGLRRVR